MVGNAGVLMCFRFVHMITLVPVEIHIMLLESTDLNSIPGPMVEVKKFCNLDKSPTPIKCYFVKSVCYFLFCKSICNIKQPVN